MSGYRYPSITAKDMPGQLVQLKSYLIQLVNELNAQKTASDTGTAVTLTGGTAAQKSQQASFDEMKSLIIKSAEVVTAIGNMVTKQLEGQYVAQSEYGTFAQNTAASFAASDKQIAALLESVERITEDNRAANDRAEERYAAISATASEVAVWMQKVISDGVEKVVTGMGHSFTDEGLRISALYGEISNLLTNMGMYVQAGDEDVLTANASGVNAINITARQYLTAGSHARFEDYGEGRTGCFYVGGNV